MIGTATPSRALTVTGRPSPSPTWLPTSAGFQKFCVLWAIAKRIEARMALLGVDTKDGSPYLKDYIALTPKLDSAMRCFKLTAFGKPAISEKPKPAANPWAGVVQK